MARLSYLGALLLFSLLSCNTNNNNEAMFINELPASRKEEVLFEAPIELINYVNTADNGYYKEKDIDNIKFSALLKPLDYIKAISLSKGQETSVHLNDDLQYFDLRVTIKDFGMEFLKYDLPNSKTYYDRINYCAFKMQNDICLIDGNDTLACTYFHFERAYDVVPYGHFILAFEPTANKNITSKTLIYNDRLFNKGLIKFSFTPDKLLRSPKLIHA